MKGLNKNDPVLQGSESKNAEIEKLTVAEAKSLGYTLINSEQKALFKGLVLKEKEHRAIDKEYNTNFKSEGTKPSPVKEMS